MKLSIRQKIRHQILKLAVLPMFLISKRDYLGEMGWFKSVRLNLPVDRVGDAVPWWSYSFILFLDERLNPKMKVFEYGSGYSTLWLSKRVSRVMSVEADRDWYEMVRQLAPDNVDVKYSDVASDDNYCQLAEQQTEKFDLIVVDGTDRARCAKNAINALAPGGVIVVDDAHRPHMRVAGEYLLANGFKVIDFYGIAPMQTVKHCTAVYYQEGNCLGI